MPEFLKKRHPYIFNHYSIIIPSATSFLIIALLAPYNFQEVGIKYRIGFAFLISILVALSVWVSVKCVKSLMPKAMAEDQWTVGKELLQILFVLSIIIVLISFAFLFIRKNEISILSLLFRISSYTLGISIFPILILVVFEQYWYQKQQLKKASALSAILKKRNEKLLSNQLNKTNGIEILLIRGENDSIELQLKPQDLIYLKSDGNYLEIHFNNAGEIQKKVIRNRLKTIEKNLPEKLFFRCHNSFIINGSHIVKVEGNARNLMIYLKDVSTPIPVSRKRANEIGPFLEAIQFS